MSKGIGGHHLRRRARHDEWLTPPALLKSLGPFDLDPCSPVSRLWDTAALHYSIEQDGLKQPWRGRVWLNPPYDRYQIERWIQRLAEHGDGVALLFARTDTEWFHRWVWARADALLFMRGRVRFRTVIGLRPAGTSGGPSVLIAYGAHNANRLARSGVDGRLVTLTPSAAPPS